ncbi:MAG: potassium channel family protein [Methylotenera sp.]|nr:potassium channel family protein [Methylotenera sp.]
MLLHFEALNQLSIHIPNLPIKHRLRVLIGLLGAFLAHVLEVLVFAFGYYLMIKQEVFGTLDGSFNHSFIDCVYFSFVCYTSLGFGDIVPTGDLRFFAGVEALSGLVLITWTASFMFLEMQKLWKDK